MDINVEISGVEGAMRDNVLAYLSVQRYAKRDDLDAAMIERLVQRAKGEAENTLRPFGFYEPKIHSRLKPSGSNWRVRLRIEPGTPVILASAEVKVSGPGADDAAFHKVIE